VQSCKASSDDPRISHKSRKTRLGPVGGRLSRVQVGPETLWVSKPFYGEIEVADSSLRRQDLNEGDPIIKDPRGGASAAIFMFLGPVAVAMGFSDLSGDVGIQHRLVGGLFTLAGVAMIAAGVSLVKPDWSSGWGSAASIIGGLGGIVVGFYLFASQLFYPARSWWTILLGLTIVAASAFALLRLPRHAASSGLRTNAKVFTALGVSAGLLWSVTSFWYQNEYAPVRLGPTLNITTELKELGKQDPVRNIRTFLGTITVKNAGTSSVQSVASLYSLVGIKEPRIDLDDEAFFAQARNKNPVSRYSREDRVEVIQFGRLLPDAWYFAPGEDYSTSVAFEVPEDGRHQYHVLRLSVQILAANRSLLSLDGSLAYERTFVDTKEYGSSWIFERYLTWANALRRVHCSVFSLVSQIRRTATIQSTV
jgi:hypothetical protein